MASSLSNFVNNLSEGIHRIKYKFGHDDQCNNDDNVRPAELNINFATVFLK